MSNEHSEVPDWAERLRRERDIRGWSEADAVAAMRTFSGGPLPVGLLDHWKRWEQGGNKPDEFYRPLIAPTFWTVVESIFPSRRLPFPSQTIDERLLSRSAMDSHELIQRIRQFSIDGATLDAIELTVEQLCCEYSGRDTAELITESHEWLSRITHLLDQRFNNRPAQELTRRRRMDTLLIGCLEYDTGHYQAAEAARTRALQLAEEAVNASIPGWAHKLRAWFALTNGRYREVIEPAHAGQDIAPGRSVSVQLLAQEANAWARMANQRNALRALEKARILLDSLPYPNGQITISS